MNKIVRKWDVVKHKGTLFERRFIIGQDMAGNTFANCQLCKGKKIDDDTEFNGNMVTINDVDMIRKKRIVKYKCPMCGYVLRGSK